MMVANGDLIMQEIIIYGSVVIKAERSKYKVLPILQFLKQNSI